MKYIDLTLPTPAANLACDEALLDLCETGAAGELLRFWEPREPFVVLGYANQSAREVKLDACRAHSVPVFRRSTGGGTVLQGPGCLNYSLFLKIPETGPLQSITGTNNHILERHQAALAPLMQSPVNIRGHTDLAAGDLKFSGNAQRRRRTFLIFHGTFLLHFDIASVEKYLHPPSKQPSYRRDRPHAEFLTNLALPPGDVKSALRKIWRAEQAAQLDIATKRLFFSLSPIGGEGWGEGDRARTWPNAQCGGRATPHPDPLPSEGRGNRQSPFIVAVPRGTPEQPAEDLPLANLPELVIKYSSDDWTFKF